GVELLDLSLVAGVPGFLQTLEVIAAALQVERVIVASELAAANADTHTRIGALFPTAELHQVAHEQFKSLTAEARLIVRTGEWGTVGACWTNRRSRRRSRKPMRGGGCCGRTTARCCSGCRRWKRG